MAGSIDNRIELIIEEKLEAALARRTGSRPLVGVFDPFGSGGFGHNTKVCYYGGVAYSEGSRMTQNGESCVCRDGSWNCGPNPQ